MSVTTFQDKLAACGRAPRQAIAERKPRPTSAIPAAEFRALLQGCALFDMSWQAKLVLSGEDRVRWLNGMVTNNIRDLAPGHGVYSFLLNAQGRIQGDLVAYNRGDYLLVTTDREQAPTIAEIFDRYIIMDDVEVADISDKLAAIGVAGPKAREILAAAGIDVVATRSRAGDRRGVARASASRSRAARSRRWMATRSGLPPRMSRKSGTRWSAPEPRPSAAMRWSCIASRAAFRVSESICGSAICRRRPGSSTRLNFSQGLLHRAGDCGAHSLARQRASHVHRLRSARASRRSREPRFAPTTRMWARSPARRGFRFPAASGRWRWYLRREVAAPGHDACRSASRAPPYKTPSHSASEYEAYGRKRKETRICSNRSPPVQHRRRVAPGRGGRRRAPRRTRAREERSAAARQRRARGAATTCASLLPCKPSIQQSREASEGAQRAGAAGLGRRLPGIDARDRRAHREGDAQAGTAAPRARTSR